jgi:hypothetical protein
MGKCLPFMEKRLLLEKKQLFIRSPFIQPEDSLPCSQDRTNGLYREPQESSVNIIS